MLYLYFFLFFFKETLFSRKLYLKNFNIKNKFYLRTKVGVVIDGVNAAFTSKSVYLREQTIVHHLKQFLRAQDFTLCQAFLQFLQNDWVGIVSVPIL